jgi:GTPase SAR1 family protein
MYELASGIYQSYFAPPKLNILIVGIDGAGKTALLERIKVTTIITKLDNIDDVDNSSNAGAAVAGVGIDIEHDGLLTKRHPACSNNASSSSSRTTTPSMMRGNSSLGGIPARLPPPLPPKQVARGRRRVEEMLLLQKKGFVCDHDNNHDDTVTNMTTKTSKNSTDADDDGYNGDDDKGTRRRRSIDHDNNFLTTPKSQNQSLVSLSPGFNSVINILTPAISTPRVVAAVANNVNNNNNNPITRRKSGLIGLLSHCPSPMKYQNAGMLLDDDEYHQQEEVLMDDVNNNGKSNSKDNDDDDDDDVWNNDYLQNYHIEYDDNEEFDVAIQPHKNSSVTTSSSTTPRKKTTRSMMPLERIRPTLGQNLAKLDLCGCQCSLFDLSGALKMRPLWDRYYDDTDAIIFVVDGAETSFSKLQQSRAEFERLCQNDAVHRRSRDLGLPIMIFVNRLDVAYCEYDAGVAYAEYDASKEIAKFKRRASLEKKVDFVNGTHLMQQKNLARKNSNKFVGDNDDDDDDCNVTMVSKRVVDFDDLAVLFGFPRAGRSLGSSIPSPDRGNIFLFGGSAKSGEGVRAAMEYLVAHARTYNSTRTYNSR